MGVHQFTKEWAQLAYFSMENSSEMIFWVRPDGSFYYVNPAVLNKMGYTAEEMAELKATDILADYKDDERLALRSKIDNHGRHIVRATLLCKDGGTIPVESVNNSIKVGDQVINCAFVRDISSQVRVEAEMLAAADQLSRENARLRSRYQLIDELNIVGTSRRLLNTLERAERFAQNDRPVLIQGESGVGKESMAQYVHLNSARGEREMVSINCATLQENTIISKLFGHVKGAFTGAYKDTEGLFSQANDSTLFMDEVGELTPQVQAMLLRVLQLGEYNRMGDGKLFKTNARIIAATNRDLSAMVAAGDFREDLRYRLDVLKLELPPLRERRDDAPQLLRYKLNELNLKYGLSKEMPQDVHLQRLLRYPFPGNIRELFNLIERSYFSTDGPVLEFPETMFTGHVAQRYDTAPLTYQENEKRHLLRVLEHCDWKISGPGGACEVLDLKRGTLMAKMRKLGLERG